MNKLVSGAIGVEVKLIGQGNKFYLPEVPYLRNKRVKHIDFCSIPKTPSGNVVSILTSQMFITLFEANSQKELIQELPILELSIQGNKMFINKIIDLQHSYITIPGATPLQIGNKSIYLVFWYDEPEIWGVVNTVERTSIQSIELTLTGYKTFFSENRDLLNKRFQNIVLNYPSYSAIGKPGIEKHHIENKFLTLRKGNLEFFKQIPLYLFYQLLDTYPLRLQNIQFDLQNSYIESLTITADDLKTVFFNVVLDDSANLKMNKR